MGKMACFDLEGPLSPQDNAYEVMGLVEEGHALFEVLSRYDDLLTLEERENYEPGDTLKLIAPFLVLHGITGSDIQKVSKKARIVKGAKETISRLKSKGWSVFIISTSYEQHALNIATRLGVEKKKVACTTFSIDVYIEGSKKHDLKTVERMEQRILNEVPSLNEDRMKDALDRFFFKELPKTKLGKMLEEVEVVGGQRKVDAMRSFALSEGVGMEEIMAVGDSITDYKMLREVRNHGAAVVFNGNEYCMPYGNIAIATLDMRFLLDIALPFDEGGRANAIEVAKCLEEDPESHLELVPEGVLEELRARYGEEIPGPRFHCLEGADEEKIRRVTEIHKSYRKHVRGEAAKLG